MGWLDSPRHSLWHRALAVAILLSVAHGPPDAAAQQPSRVPHGGQRAANSVLPSADKPHGNWSRFRGPEGRGISHHTNLSVAWDAASGQGIRWKARVPLEGNNSPILWNDRVFLSGADAEQREVYCYHGETGALLWRKSVSREAGRPQEVPEVLSDTGYAAPTPATDGQRVYAVFANGDVVALTLDGAEVWTRHLGLPKSPYGYAASPMVHGNRLVIQFDQGSTRDRLSKILALEAATGATVWEVGRDVSSSWSSPILVQVDGQDQVVTASNPWVIGYDATSGREAWRVRSLRGDVGPSPTHAGGAVFVTSETSLLSALRPPLAGDAVPEPRVLWTAEDGLPDTASPLATDEFVFLLASFGILTCYDAKSGALLWDEEFDSDFSSSPSLADGRLYLFGKDGACWILGPTRAGCTRLSEAALGEPCVTSPAFRDGRIYIRGQHHLFCIGSP